MQVMIVYVLLVLVAEVAAFGVGTVLDRVVPAFSMILFMALFFGILAVCWPIAVMITEKWLTPTTAIVPSPLSARTTAATPCAQSLSQAGEGSRERRQRVEGGPRLPRASARDKRPRLTPAEPFSTRPVDTDPRR